VLRVGVLLLLLLRLLAGALPGRGRPSACRCWLQQQQLQQHVPQPGAHAGSLLLQLVHRRCLQRLAMLCGSPHGALLLHWQRQRQQQRLLLLLPLLRGLLQLLLLVHASAAVRRGRRHRPSGLHCHSPGGSGSSSSSSMGEQEQSTCSVQDNYEV
jgi:hypothetical protein